MEKNRQEKKVYRSMMEIERDFFPILHAERLEKGRSKDPGVFGTRLATQILKDIRQQLVK